MVDRNMLAEVRALWADATDNAQEAAFLIKPHAQEIGRQLDALKPELLSIYSRVHTEAEAVMGKLVLPESATKNEPRGRK